MRLLKKGKLSLCMALFVAAAFILLPQNVDAATKKNVNTFDALKIALEDPTSVDITLTGNIEKELPKSIDKEVAAIKVKGTNTLDLNGYSIHVINNYNCVDGNKNKVDAHQRDFMRIEKNAKLTVNDTKGGGRMNYDGYMIGTGGEYKGICERDLFNVLGTLVLNKGTFEAGRVLKQWVSFNMPYDGDGSMHSGNEHQQIWGKVAKVQSGGKVVVNGGTLHGRGMRKTALNYPNYSLTRSCVIQVLAGGKASVNGGTFYGNGGADIFANSGTLYVRGGSFEVNKYDKIRHPSEDQYSNDYYLKGSVGTAKIPASSLLVDGTFSNVQVDYCTTKITPNTGNNNPHTKFQVGFSHNGHTVCEPFSTDEIWWDNGDMILELYSPLKQYYEDKEECQNYKEEKYLYFYNVKNDKKNNLVAKVPVYTKLFVLEDITDIVSFASSSEWIVEAVYREFGPSGMSEMVSDELRIHCGDSVDYNQYGKMPEGYEVDDILAFTSHTPTNNSFFMQSEGQKFSFTYKTLNEQLKNAGYRINVSHSMYYGNTWKCTTSSDSFKPTDQMTNSGNYTIIQTIRLVGPKGNTIAVKEHAYNIDFGTNGKGNVKRIVVDIDLPQKGKEPKLNTSDYKDKLNTSTVSEVKWSVYTGSAWNPMTSGTFQSGKDYKLTISFVPKDMAKYYYNSETEPSVILYSEKVDKEDVTFNSSIQKVTVEKIYHCYPAITIGGITLNNGQYLKADANAAESVVKEPITENQYAYFREGVLTLRNFEKTNKNSVSLTINDTTTINLVGTNSLINTSTDAFYGTGINSTGAITIKGDGILKIDAINGIEMATKALTLESGEIRIDAERKGITTGFGAFTMNGGLLHINAGQIGIHNGSSSEDMKIYMYGGEVRVAGGNSAIYDTKNKISLLGHTNYDYVAGKAVDGSDADILESETGINQYKYIRVAPELISTVVYRNLEGSEEKRIRCVNGTKHTLLKADDIPMAAPSANKRFKYWDVNGDEKQPGDTITVGNDTTINAVWEVFCSGAHTYDEGRVAIKPTCGDTGLKVYTCTICEEAKTEPIAKLPNHTFDAGVITTQATETAPGVKTYTCTVCGFKKTEDVAYVPGTPTLTEDELQVSNKLGLTPQGTKDILSYAEEKGISKNTLYLTEDAITKSKKEELSGATFGPLQGRVTKTTKNSITLTWKKVSGANGYIIYGNKCGTKNKYKKITTLSAKKTSYVSKKMNKKKLAKGTYYKYVVVAYKLVDGKKITISASKTLHAATTGGKYGNAKSVKLKNVKKDKVTIKRKKTFTIKASEVKKDKKIKIHRKLAYEISNKAIATVSSKGKITAKKKGTCYVYVYAQNGMYKRIKVTVK